MAAAMEPIASPSMERPSPPRAAAMPPPPPPPALAAEPPQGRRFPTAIIGSSLLALIVVAVVVLRLLSSAPHAPAAPPGPKGHIALTAVRPVASAVAPGGALLPTQVSFAEGTRTVDIEVSSGGATVQAPVTVAVSVGQPSHMIIDATYLLNQSGETVISLTPPGGAYAPGDYSVAITTNGQLLGATVFDVR